MVNLNKKEVENRIKNEGFKPSEFYRWLKYQTVPVLENGEMGFFEHDLEKWLYQKRAGIKDPWVCDF